MRIKGIENPMVLSQVKQAYYAYKEASHVDKEKQKHIIEFILNNYFPDLGYTFYDIKKYFEDEENKQVVIEPIIKNEKPKKWIQNYDAKRTENEIECSMFDQYLRILRSENKDNLAFKLNKEVYNIMDCIPNPKIERNWLYRGLVFGKVQSGKTSNFIGLINKAIDVGYDFVIVLAGISEELRQQTQQRIDEYILRRRLKSNRYESIDDNIGLRLRSATDKVNPSALTYSSEKVGKKKRDGEFNRGFADTGVVGKGKIQILVIKKNSSILKNQLLSYLYSICDQDKENEDRKISNRTCLIIDDECDNASILSQTKKEFSKGEENRAINLNIRRVINLFSRCTYVGYTATPQNVVMQHLDSEEKIDNISFSDGFEKKFKIKKNLTLYPEDFIQILEPSSEYLGLSEFLSEENDYIRTIPDSDLPDFKSEELIINDSIEDAVLNFISNIYIRKILDGAVDNNTMLIHPSRIKIDINKYTLLIQSLKNKIVGDIHKGKASSTFYLKIHTLIQNKSKIEDIDYDILLEIIEQIEIITFHSGSNDSLNFKILRDRILIGGDKLSRGFTIEGLSVTYFFRRSSRLDSLHQMARWFGYRVGFENLIKIYMTEEDRSYFEFMGSVDSDLNDQIYSMNFEESNPRDFGLSMIYNPAYLGYNSDTKRRMDLTDPNKMRHFSIENRVSKIIGFRRLVNNKNVNLQNLKYTLDWIESLEENYDLVIKSNDYKKLVGNDNNKKFINVSTNHVIDLIDNLKFYENIITDNFLTDLKNSIDTKLKDWSVMISRPKTSKYENEYMRERTYSLDDDNVYVSSVSSGSSGVEDLFDLIENESEIKSFEDQLAKGVKKTVLINRLRKAKGRPLLKVFISRPNKESKANHEIKISESVQLLLILPDKQSSNYVRRENVQKH